MAFPEILKDQPENVADLPAPTRAKLDSIKQQLQTEGQPIAKVALQRLESAIKRADLVKQLSSIRSESEFSGLTESLRKDLGTLQSEVETTPEAGKRVATETAGAAKEKVDALPTIAKVGLYGAGIAVSAVVIAKVVDWIKKFLVGAKDMTLEGLEGAANIGKKGLKGAWTVSKYVFGALGLAAIGRVGYEYFTKKESPGTKTA